MTNLGFTGQRANQQKPLDCKLSQARLAHVRSDNKLGLSPIIYCIAVWRQYFIKLDPLTINQYREILAHGFF